MSNQLDELANEFQHWRETRSNRTVTPENLKKKTYQALQHYPKAILTKRLGVNRDFLNRIEQERKTNTATFIALPSEPENDPKPTNFADHSIMKALVLFKNVRMQVSGTPTQLVSLAKSLGDDR